LPHEVTLLRDIALGIVFAALAAHVARLVRQPLILGYIAGGVILSPRLGFGLVKSAESIELISEIGLILLLFIIGLEIDLRELKRLGRSMLALGVGQFVINALLGLVFFSWLGYRVTRGNFDLLYLSIIISLSSTLIVVKLLREKFELKLLPGRLTLGVLVVQDIWAILFMAVQPNLADPDVLTIARSIARGAVVVAVAFLASRYVLSRLFEAAARRPELVLISALAWCFLLSGAAERLGLSREMGALIAGVSISSFPYGSDVISKVSGVRDFFVTLFFVALGMKIPVPTAEILEQVRAGAAALRDDFGPPSQRLSNVVFMGMGEPLANYARVLAAVRRIIEPPPSGFGISARSVTVSTVGLAPVIRKLADERLGVTLALSLHAPDDELRDTLVPVNNRWKISEALDAARYYADITGRRVSVEYALIRDVNDQPWRADLLGRMLREQLSARLVHVNLIPLNPTPGSEWDASPLPVQEEFVDRVRAAGVACTVRDTRGREIAAACGQLAAES